MSLVKLGQDLIQAEKDAALKKQQEKDLALERSHLYHVKRCQEFIPSVGEHPHLKLVQDGNSLEFIVKDVLFARLRFHTNCVQNYDRDGCIFDGEAYDTISVYYTNPEWGPFCKEQFARRLVERLNA